MHMPSDPWPPTRIERLEAELTPEQRFRLVEIAHETLDPAVRDAALALLHSQRLMVALPMEPSKSKETTP